ncbi:hypothetical protein [uncultured Flavobacterium sp.]|uniref:hypothetical protein n=1 Tax=uncultured Flavobacterium sp. TaxID=165435 RepID=UPI0030EE0F5F|tara:strand:+ start:669 stop:1133 length:465 start_codon:yes stop_codon:yes gene_type:complete
MQKKYRIGALGALTDEYEKVIIDFKKMLLSISDAQFIKVLDTNEPLDFQSIRNITFHVVRSGYVYSNYIRKYYKEESIAPDFQLETVAQAIENLDLMFAYSDATFENKWHFTDDDLIKVRITTSWTTYDLEAICEHAIVHVLRHKRQIEKIFLS